MTAFFNCVIVAFSGVILFQVRKKKISALFISLLLFDILFVLPLLFEAIFGIASTPYIGFQLALNDFETAVIYCIFVLAVQLIFFLSLHYSKQNVLDYVKRLELMREKIHKNRFLCYFAYGLILFELGILLFSPDPLNYFHLGTFEMEWGNPTWEALQYHERFASLGVYAGLLSTVLLKLYDVKSKKLHIFFRVISIILLMLLDGKRTMYTFIIGILFIIDFTSTKKKSKKVWLVIKAAFLIIGYFVVYSYITGKYEYNTDWYAVISEYFFKSNCVKVSIYSLLNPSKLQILEYPLQSIIYDLLYFIPRDVWATKPLPFPQYYSSAVQGYQELTFVGWYFQTNCYGEIIANCGFAGFFIAPIYIIILCKFVDSSKSIISLMLGLFFVLFIQMFEYSDLGKIIFLLWIIMFIFEKIIIKNRNRIRQKVVNSEGALKCKS